MYGYYRNVCTSVNNTAKHGPTCRMLSLGAGTRSQNILIYLKQPQRRVFCPWNQIWSLNWFAKCIIYFWRIRALKYKGHEKVLVPTSCGLHFYLPFFCPVYFIFGLVVQSSLAFCLSPLEHYPTPYHTAGCSGELCLLCKSCWKSVCANRLLNAAVHLLVFHWSQDNVMCVRLWSGAAEQVTK